jgi:hypothetical protein
MILARFVGKKKRQVKCAVSARRIYVALLSDKSHRWSHQRQARSAADTCRVPPVAGYTDVLLAVSRVLQDGAPLGSDVIAMIVVLPREPSGVAWQ